MKSLLRIFILSTLVLFLLTACGGGQQAEPTATVPPTETPVPPTPTLEPTVTSLPTDTPTITPTATPVGPMDATVNLTMNLRSGPGTAHTIIATVEEGSVVSVMGRAPGDEWVRVEIPEDEDQIPLAGWLYVPFLDFTEDFTTLPEFEIIESFIIHGRVFDSDGGPIEGVEIEVRQLQADGTETTRTFTDAEGNFYAYLPPESYGSWNVEVVGVDCESRIVNEDCDIVDYFIQTGSELVPIPQRETIIFIYELSSTRLTGQVLDEDEEPVVNVRVFAEYDRAITSGYTDEEGRFSLPAADGNWEVYTVTYNPFQAGESVFVRIENGQQAEEPVLALP